jgi:BASS family bile acid:Na+ symporter
MDLNELFFAALKIFATAATFFSLLDLGLQLELKETIVGIRNPKFTIFTLLWGFILGPAIAYALTLVLPLTQSYGNGLIIMSFVPGAAYLAMLVERANGDVRYAASYLLLTSFAMVIFIPLALPFLVSGVSVTSWLIAKPLIMLVLVPLLIGILFRKNWLEAATRWRPLIKKIASVALVGALATTIASFGKGIIVSAGSYALASLLLFYALATVGSWYSAYSFPYERRSVLTLGIVSRNSGPAVAIAVSIPNLPGETFVLIGMGIIVQVVLSFPLAYRGGKKYETKNNN